MFFDEDVDCNLWIVARNGKNLIDLYEINSFRWLPNYDARLHDIVQNQFNIWI